MKIAAIEARLLQPDTAAVRFMDSMPPSRFQHVYVCVVADDGTRGEVITYLMNAGEFEQALPGLRSMLVGRDPHEIERVSARLTQMMERPTPIASVIDICLWDMLGRHHGEPIYRLIGGARNRIRAYASTYSYDTIEEYVAIAVESREAGFTALKLHAHGVPRKDIAVCRAVREAVGDSLDLMLDPVNMYDRTGAMEVGRALQELNYVWFEAPINDSDLAGLRHLRQHLWIPIAGAESVVQGLRAYPKYLSENLLDALRSVGDQSGGITAMRKTAAVCEAFNVKYEPHSYGTTLVQAAHLHVMLSIFHCDFVELPVPRGVWDFAMTDTIWIDARGNVAAPTKPGLGYDIDHGALDTITTRHM